MVLVSVWLLSGLVFMLPVMAALGFWICLRSVPSVEENRALRESHRREAREHEGKQMQLAQHFVEELEQCVERENNLRERVGWLSCRFADTKIELEKAQSELADLKKTRRLMDDGMLAQWPQRDWRENAKRHVLRYVGNGLGWTAEESVHTFPSGGAK